LKIHTKAKFTVRFLYLYVFVTGASVMALELAASRFLAPYYGTSMIVWANIIGLVLLSLSLGYWYGGRLADRRPDGALLMKLSLWSGILTCLLPLWGKMIFPMLSGGILGTPLLVIVSSFFAILIVFAPPVFLLAMVSPFAIRLVTAETKGEIGKIAGNLYAFSTMGSLVGTFGTAFITIPFLGARETIFLWSAALIAISAWGLRHTRSRWWVVAVLLPLALYLLTRAPAASAEGSEVVWAKDTLYQYVRVIKSSDGTTSLVYNEGGGVQSVHRPGDALSPDDYYDDYLLLPFFPDDPRQVLVLGSAGGTIPRLMAKYVKPMFPGLNITGVEIDPAVIGLDERYFGLEPGDATFISQDARVFVGNTKQKYDIVIVDAYSQQIYIPFHLVTLEFFQEVRNKLTDDGLLALNVNAVSPDSKLLVAMAKTVQRAFPYSYAVKARGEYNYILLGSQRPLQTEKLQRIESGSPLEPLRREWPAQLTPLTEAQVKEGLLLTDNRAPTEMLTDSMIFGAAKEQR
jgi:predicted membrane-bound spermidine synthase